jgi:membrane peptidoglycan carboxypeptidase
MRGPAGDSARADEPTVPLAVSATADAGRRQLPYAAPPGRPASDWQSPEHPHRGRARRILTRMAIFFAVLLLMVAVAFGALLVLTPSAGNARELAREQAVARGAVYPGPAVPGKFAASLVATEDKRFYSEPGVDVLAIGRVAAGYLTGRGDQGGATLYQQLAKLLYTEGQSGLSVEPEQIALAVKLDLTYSKQQILQMYTDIVYFGHGYYGLAAASCGYFGVRPAGLSWPEAATLAGLVQGPSIDDPIDHPAAARQREAHVLGRLVATGVLTPSQAAAAQAVPLSSMLAHGGSSASSCTG